MNKLNVLFAGYIATILGLFLYSFTQIDLSLALSRNESLQGIVRSFQQIGYFDRPLSVTLFLIVIGFLFIFYIAFLILAYRKKLQKKFVFILILATTIILTFSYNAFSYDIFNYIFDAKIVTHYGDNPYLQKALDYPQDPMLSFMRWTHREYPYGPMWLGITIPLSFIGFGFFLPTFILFKILMAISFLGCVYFIAKIMENISPENEIPAIIFFGLNPLVLIEGVVSGHIDIVMMFFALFACYMLVKQKHLYSYGLLIFSAGIKFATGLILPIFALVHWQRHKHKKVQWGFIFSIMVLLLILGVIAQSMRGTFQPWYLIDVFAFTALIAYRYYVIIPSVVISFFALLNYVPFLSVGNWDKPIPQMISDLNFFSYSLAFFIIVMYFVMLQIQFARSVRAKKKHK